MFDLNLLSEPGIQLSESVDCSISFIKEKRPNPTKTPPNIKKKKTTTVRQNLYSSNSLFVIIFMAISGVIFYPMLSNLNSNMLMPSAKVSQEQVVDKVLKVILESKNDYTIESLEFSSENILIHLSSFDITSMKFFQEKMDLLNSGAVRVFGDNNNYSMMAKFPWKITSDDFIDSPESFYKIVKTGKNVKTVISEHEIVMNGSTSDIISIFLQLANAERLQTNEMMIHSINPGNLIFAVKFSN